MRHPWAQRPTQVKPPAAMDYATMGEYTRSVRGLDRTPHCVLEAASDRGGARDLDRPMDPPPRVFWQRKLPTCGQGERGVAGRCQALVIPRTLGHARVALQFPKF